MGGCHGPKAAHWEHEPEAAGRKIMGRKIPVSIFLPLIFLPNSPFMGSFRFRLDLLTGHEPERSAANRRDFGS
jgi:hypothetical protein